MVAIIVVFTLVAASAYVCYFVAKKRNADTTYWLVLAGMLGPFAIPFVFFAKPEWKSRNDQKRNT